jgi:hypothetical protein
MSPYEEAQKALKVVVDQLLAFEAVALECLPNIPWDFSVLRGHLETMHKNIGDQSPLKAWGEYADFALTPAAVKLGRIKSDRKRAAALAASKKAKGRSTRKKQDASRENAEKARQVRMQGYRIWARGIPSQNREKAARLKLQRQTMIFHMLRARRRADFDVDLIQRLNTEIESLQKRIRALVPPWKPRKL